VPSIFNSLSREGVLQRLVELTEKDMMSGLKIKFLTEKRKAPHATSSKDFYSIHRMMKEKNLDMKTLNKFILHLEEDREMRLHGNSIKETF